MKLVKMVGYIFKIIIIIMIFQFMFIPISNAGFWDEIKESADSFVENGKDKASETGVNQDDVDDAIGKIYNILLALGVALSVIVGAALGIKFMMGSIEEQAKVKEMLMPYATGCIVTFGAFGIWKLVIELLGNI